MLIEDASKVKRRSHCGFLKTIKPLRTFKFGAHFGLIKKMFVLQYENSTVEIVILPELIFIIEAFSIQKELITAALDSRTDKLFFFFEGGVVEVFHLDVESINSILTHSSNINSKSAVKNLLKDMVHHVRSIHVDFSNKGPVSTILKNYNEVFHNFPSNHWFENILIFKKSFHSVPFLKQLRVDLNFHNSVISDLSQTLSNDNSLTADMIDPYDHSMSVRDLNIQKRHSKRSFQNTEEEFKFNLFS